MAMLKNTGPILSPESIFNIAARELEPERINAPVSVSKAWAAKRLTLLQASASMRTDPVFFIGNQTALLPVPAAPAFYPFSKFIICAGGTVAFVDFFGGHYYVTSISPGEFSTGYGIIVEAWTVAPGEMAVTPKSYFAMSGAQAWESDWNENATMSSVDSVSFALSWVCAPSHHVIIESPAHVRSSSSPKIPRAHERPRCILIKPNEVHKIYKHTGEEAATLRTLSPHARRGHSKVLRSERYTEGKRGKTIYVRPTWVGPGEWETAGRRYKVVL